ncbi:MAG: N-acetylmuramoyl-L-alanine amidase [Bacteroidota bacterium]
MNKGTRHGLVHLLLIGAISISASSSLFIVQASKEPETWEDMLIAQLAKRIGKEYKILPSLNFDERKYKDSVTKECIGDVQCPTILLLHYTALEEEEAEEKLIDIATLNPASTHYLVNRKGNITRFVAEDKRAWHAGLGAWDGETDVNTVSIGIETINLGCRRKFYPAGACVDGSTQEWEPYDEALLKTLAELCKDIIKRYNINPRHVIGHSDMATTKKGHLGRKVDPGPLFPWERFHKEHGIGAWYNLSSPLSKVKLPSKEDQVVWVQNHLREYGYTTCPQTGKLDIGTTRAVKMFQMHFRPTNISGEIDEETIQILAQLVDKYC